MLEEIRKKALKIKDKQQAMGENLDKIDNVINFLSDEQCFYKIDIYSAVPLLLYLGVKEEDVKDVYFDLIKPDNYKLNNLVRPAIDIEDIQKNK